MVKPNSGYIVDALLHDESSLDVFHSPLSSHTVGRKGKLDIHVDSTLRQCDTKKTKLQAIQHKIAAVEPADSVSAC